MLFLPLMVTGQGETDTSAEAHTPKEFTNSLGMRFLELPDTPILISAWETRVSDWDAYVKDKGLTWTRKPAFSQTPHHPVVCVTLVEAAEFCAWLTDHERKSGALQASQTYRLPSKSEWDTASGITAGGEYTRSPHLWGDAWPPPGTSGNYGSESIGGAAGDGFEFTAPVGQFSPAPSGCHDLGGNVWEWTSDAESNGKVIGALRGGSWMYWRKEYLETQYVYHAPSGTRSPGIGFRCVLEDSEATARLGRERQQQASKLMEKPIVEQEEIDEMIRKLMENLSVDETEIEAETRNLLEKPEALNQEEIEEARRMIMAKPAVDETEVEAMKRKLMERKTPQKEQQPGASTAPASTQKHPATP